MKVRELMTTPAISVGAGESAETAARLLARYNIGGLPVCDPRGNLEGMLTDRDLVTRCMAAQRPREKTSVGQLMTRAVLSVSPDTEVKEAARLMGAHQVRRLPVVEKGRLCGILSLGDLASQEESFLDTGAILGEISGNITHG